MLTKDLPEHANFFVPARELQVSRDTSYTSTYDLVRLQHEVRVISYARSRAMSLPILPLEPLAAALDSRTHVQEAWMSASMTNAIRKASDTRDTDGLHVLEKRINSLLSTSLAQNKKEPCWKIGADVARTFVEECGWTVVESHGQVWIQHAHAHLEQVAKYLGACVDDGSNPIDSGAEQILASVVSLAQLVGYEVMGSEGESHPEFYRTIVTPNVPKIGHALVSVCEDASQVWGSVYSHASIALSKCLDVIQDQVVRHATTYRTFVARIHALCMQILFGPYATLQPDVPPRCVYLTASATRLLSAIHITGAASSSLQPDHDARTSSGSSKLTQAQLWAATVAEILDALIVCVCGSVPSVPWHASGLSAPNTDPLAWMSPSAADFTQSIPACFGRCELLLGSTSCPDAVGVLPYFLSTPTPRAVPVPIARCVQIATAMIQAHIPPGHRAPIDQLRFEHMYLPQIRQLGARFLVQVVMAFQQQAWPFVYASEAISKLSAMAEYTHGTAERSLALCAIDLLLARDSVLAPNGFAGGAGIPLDPASTVVQRIARICIQTLSAFVVQEPMSWSCMPPLKRTRAFESDAIVASTRVLQDAIMSKTCTEMDMVCHAASVLVALFGLLNSSAAPGHRDLARTGALALVGLTEVLIDARVLDASNDAMLTMCERCVDVLTSLVVSHAGALVAYVLARVHAILVRGTQSSISRVRVACAVGVSRLLVVIRPRVPPLTDHIDSSALEEQVAATEAQDQVPLPVAGWQGPESVSTSFATIDEVAPRVHKGIAGMSEAIASMSEAHIDLESPPSVPAPTTSIARSSVNELHRPIRSEVTRPNFVSPEKHEQVRTALDSISGTDADDHAQRCRSRDGMPHGPGVATSSFQSFGERPMESDHINETHDHSVHVQSGKKAVFPSDITATGNHEDDDDDDDALPLLDADASDDEVETE